MKEFFINDEIVEWLEKHNLDINKLLSKIMEDWEYFSGELL